MMTRGSAGAAPQRSMLQPMATDLETGPGVAAQPTCWWPLGWPIPYSCPAGCP